MKIYQTEYQKIASAKELVLAKETQTPQNVHAVTCRMCLRLGHSIDTHCGILMGQDLYRALREGPIYYGYMV